MQKITPFLWFDNQAEDAANYYVSVFKNAKINKVMRYGEGSPGKPGSVMTVSFTIEGEEFTALNGGQHYKMTPGTSFVVHCKSQDEVDYYWDKLLAGGTAYQCGWLTDKFGVTWQIVPDEFLTMLADKDGAKVRRTTEAMMKMVKLDLPTLKQAFEAA
jgi:predicted 3-demethylubiquinone-9 3-methyltransferase (glyoxalase superfamily)